MQSAFERSRRIDYDLVHAQQARRLLDRVVGFTVSPRLSRRLRAGLSAGRVQSAALRILAERDEKIRVFTPAEFFDIDVALSIDDGEPVTAQVVDADGNVARFDQRSDADALAAHLASVPVTLDDVATVDASQNPKPPFTTSTLQQAASSLLKLSVSDTMAIAQKTRAEPGRLAPDRPAEATRRTVGEAFRTVSDHRQSGTPPSTVPRASPLRRSPRIITTRQRTTP